MSAACTVTYTSAHVFEGETMPSDEVPYSHILLTEYEQLKNEQRARIGFRDNLLYVTLAASAGVLVSTLQFKNHTAALLALPPVSILLGWTYLVNDEKISAIGVYIREKLSPALADAVPGHPGIFDWEKDHRTDRRRRSRKYFQLAVDMTAFCVAPLAAIVGFWLSASTPGLLIAISAVEASSVVALATQVFHYAELR